MRARDCLRVALVAMCAAGAAMGDGLGKADAGADVFVKCTGCHEIGPEARDRIGPHLNGIFGRRAAAHEGYRYSRSMARAGDDGLIWTAETLDAYLENPRALVSKTRMSFRGLKDAKDRANVLAYLRDFSDRPSDLPEAEPTASATYHKTDPATRTIHGEAG